MVVVDCFADTQAPPRQPSPRAPLLDVQRAAAPDMLTPPRQPSPRLAAPLPDGQMTSSNVQTPPRQPSPRHYLPDVRGASFPEVFSAPQEPSPPLYSQAMPISLVVPCLLPNEPDLHNIKPMLSNDPTLEDLGATSRQHPHELERPGDHFSAVAPITYSLASTPVTSFNFNHMNGSRKAIVTANYELIR
jgi:hypothetical protein